MDKYFKFKEMLKNGSLYMHSEYRMEAYSEPRVDLRQMAIKRNYQAMFQYFLEQPNPPATHDIKYKYIYAQLFYLTVKTEMVIITPELFKLMKELALKGCMYEE